MLKIRLKRVGRKHDPSYRIIVTEDFRGPKSGKYIENLGNYDPRRDVKEINGERVNFENGKGYIEKDWGKSFPTAWIWTQSNHFSNENLSFMFSIAKVPFLGMKFNGFLSAIWYEGKFFKFATYTGAKVKTLDINPDNIQILVEDKNHSLYFEIARKGIESMSLKAPQEGTMSGRIAESINSKIRLKLFDIKNNIIIDDLGVNAGFEAKDPEVLKPKK